ncbi:MAG TPA: transketolase C-terminal domain-containing protein [Solirubrobacteraceae bacterium]|jgi:transketolase|nr:transketolase C-terminal domain-containing protein [Solirubrobacteraceae bacterium]
MFELGKQVAIRSAFGPALLPLARADERVVVVTADLGGSVGVNPFREEFPQRYVNCGVAEADMISLSAGLASEGYMPFAVTFGSFIGRAVDHMRQSIGHNKLKVCVVGSHGGISNGQDGPSAHAIEDVGIMRSMPTFAIVAPACANELAGALNAIAELEQPVYMRLYREPSPVFTDPDEPFEFGKAVRRHSGEEVTLLSYGPHVGFCLEWIDQLSSLASIDLLEVHTITPLDEDGVLESVARTGRVVVVEDHFKRGGLGSSVAELLAERLPTPMRHVALDGYARSGPYYELRDAVGLGYDAVADAVRSVLAA